MKENYDFSNARPNPYAERMKNGYSIAIHYETRDDMENEAVINTIRILLKQPKLNSLHLYFKNDEKKTDKISEQNIVTSPTSD